MKRLLSAGVMVGLLVSVASIAWAETTAVKSSTSNTSDRVRGKAAEQGKVTKSSAASATQDPCASVKNDPNQYAKCQDATKPVGLSTRSGRKGSRSY